MQKESTCNYIIICSFIIELVDSKLGVGVAWTCSISQYIHISIYNDVLFIFRYFHVQQDPSRLQSCEKALGCALLSTMCCWFVWKMLWERDNFELAHLKKKKVWQFGSFLVRYYCDAFLHSQGAWKHPLKNFHHLYACTQQQIIIILKTTELEICSVCMGSGLYLMIPFPVNIITGMARVRV